MVCTAAGFMELSWNIQWNIKSGTSNAASCCSILMIPLPSASFSSTASMKVSSYTVHAGNVSNLKCERLQCIQMRVGLHPVHLLLFPRIVRRSSMYVAFQNFDHGMFYKHVFKLIEIRFAAG